MIIANSTVFVIIIIIIDWLDGSFVRSFVRCLVVWVGVLVAGSIGEWGRCWLNGELVGWFTLEVLGKCMAKYSLLYLISMLRSRIWHTI